MKFARITEAERMAKLRIPTGKLRIVIDSDAKNEVDDQFAISWALRSPERFNVEAVYAVPFSHAAFQHNIGNAAFPDIEPPDEGMEQSYQEIRKLYTLLWLDPEGKVLRGADRFLTRGGGPVVSPAVEDLIRRGMEPREDPLYVVAIGAATNVASALMAEPALADRIVVVWLGGQPPYFQHGMEFNLAQDILAAQCLFDSGVPLVWVPCMNVASLLSLSDDDVRGKLLGKSPIGTYLAEIVLAQFTNLKKATDRAAGHRRVNLRGRDDQGEDYLSQFPTHHVSWSRTIWDVSTIAFLKNPGWVQSTLMPAPVLLDDCRWGTPDAARHAIRVANYCQRDLIFGDMIACLTGA